MEIIKSEFLGFNSENESLQRIIGFCNSSESKPTENIKNGSKLTELDTGDVYFFDEDIGWQKVVVGEGGGSSDLPEVTDADNGKVLTVVDGDWGVADAGGVAFYDVQITMSGRTYTLDKTYTEISEAAEAGYLVRAVQEVESGHVYRYIEFFQGSEAEYVVGFTAQSFTFSASSADGVLSYEDFG